MKKLTLVVDERELSTIRAALFLLQEHVAALPEDLAEMIAEHGTPIMASEVEHLSLRLDRATDLPSDYPQPAYSPLNCTVEIERFSGGAVRQRPA
jgi:hypothetical protein